MRRPLKEREKHTPRPDYKHGSVKVAQFINYLMLDGKKSTAQKIFDDALEEIKKKTKEDPLIVFEEALRNVSPAMEVRSRRVGGANYQVPYEVRPERRNSLSMRWILDAARNRSGAPMSKFLAEEIISASKKEGEAMKKNENMHKMAEANKAFAHFAFTGNKNKKKKTA